MTSIQELIISSVNSEITGKRKRDPQDALHDMILQSLDKFIQLFAETNNLYIQAHLYSTFINLLEKDVLIRDNLILHLMKFFGENHEYYFKLLHFIVPTCSDEVKKGLLKQIFNFTTDHTEPHHMTLFKRIETILDHILIGFPISHILTLSSQRKVNWLLSPFISMVKQRQENYEKIIKFDGVRFLYVQQPPVLNVPDHIKKQEIAFGINQGANADFFKRYGHSSSGSGLKEKEWVQQYIIVKLHELKDCRDFQTWSRFASFVYVLIVEEYIDFSMLMLHPMPYKSPYLFYFYLQFLPTASFKLNSHENPNAYAQFFLEWKYYALSSSETKFLSLGLKRMGVEVKKDIDCEFDEWEKIREQIDQAIKSTIDPPAPHSIYNQYTLFSLVDTMKVSNYLFQVIQGEPLSVHFLESVAIHVRSRLLSKILEIGFTSAHFETASNILKISPSFYGLMSKFILQMLNNTQWKDAKGEVFEKHLYWLPDLFKESRMERESSILQAISYKHLDFIIANIYKVDLQFIKTISFQIQNDDKNFHIKFVEYIFPYLIKVYNKEWKQLGELEKLTEESIQTLVQAIDPNRGISPKACCMLALIRYSAMDPKYSITALCEFMIKNPQHIMTLTYVVAQFEKSNDIVLGWFRAQYLKAQYDIIKIVQYYYHWLPSSYAFENWKNQLMLTLDSWQMARFHISCWTPFLMILKKKNDPKTSFLEGLLVEWLIKINEIQDVTVPIDILDYIHGIPSLKVDWTHETFKILQEKNWKGILKREMYLLIPRMRKIKEDYERKAHVELDMK